MAKQKADKTKALAKSTVSKENTKAIDLQKPQPAAPLLDLIHNYLTECQFREAAWELESEARKKRATDPLCYTSWKGTSKDIPSLVEIYKQWSQPALRHTEPAAGLWIVPKRSSKSARDARRSSHSDSEDTSSSSAADSPSESSSSEDSASAAADKGAERKAVHPVSAAKLTTALAQELKRKRPSSSAASTSSSSSAAESLSSEEPESEAANIQPKKLKTKQGEKIPKPEFSARDRRVDTPSSSNGTSSVSDDTESASDVKAALESEISADNASETSESDKSVESSSNSDLSSSSESALRTTSKAVERGRTKDRNHRRKADTSSETSSSSEDDISSESQAEAPPKPTSRPVKTSKRINDKVISPRKESSKSTETLSASSPVKKPSPTSSSGSSSSSPGSSPSESKPITTEIEAKPAGGKRKRTDVANTTSNTGDTTSPPTDEFSKRLKTGSAPFTRVPRTTAVDPKFASNKYVPYDYAERAHRDLIVTKGKGFTKEKNKKKKGAYRGGAISLEPKGIKFED